MWTVCVTSISHVLKLNGYGGLQAKVNEKRLRFKGWETLVINAFCSLRFPDTFTFAKIRAFRTQTLHYIKNYLQKYIFYHSRPSIPPVSKG